MFSGRRKTLKPGWRNRPPASTGSGRSTSWRPPPASSWSRIISTGSGTASTHDAAACPMGGSELVAWRLDLAGFAPAWDSGEGAYRYGGRWNSRGVRAVYCSLDPATAILEVAVHKGFKPLDTVAHALTAVT